MKLVMGHRKKLNGPAHEPWLRSEEFAPLGPKRKECETQLVLDKSKQTLQCRALANIFIDQEKQK